MRLFRFLLISTILCVSASVKAQTGFELSIKKPEPYENRTLRSERTSQKKFTLPRRFFQGLYTHYNFFFNANAKLNDILSEAKRVHKDNYDSLLSFYNYSLETTSQNKEQLDSVIYKSRTGIVMHDLRNDWIDDLYLLWGSSYFLQKQFDSAYQMFQFINYSFAEKEEDGYYKYIGSRMDGGNAQSIATKEDDRFLKRLVSDPPSRNAAFIWQIRTLTESNAFAEAGSLIATLKRDPNFPERLNNDLEEVQAYWFYRQNIWDSAAIHLSNALDNAKTKQERARWEYLIAQLYERKNNKELAQEWYTKAIDHTTDPVLDIWARLSLIRLNKEEGDEYIAKNIADLEKMVRRERYAAYRDVIYDMMAQMELERNNPEAAREYLLKGARYATENPNSRNQTYLHLADLSYEQRQYIQAASFYDSLDASILPPADLERVSKRKEFLPGLVSNLNTIHRQDSLQRIAALPEEERTDYLKKLARQIRRQRGLKEEESSSTGAANQIQPDPFGTPARNEKGDWYFYNQTLRTSGAAQFRQIWGKRPNTDNWRRASSAVAQLRTEMPGNTRGATTLGLDMNAGEITYEALLNSLPLTPEQQKLSSDSVQMAYLAAGSAYLNHLEHYTSAIEAYETFRKRFSDYFNMSEVLFNLYYSYLKAGDRAKAEEIKKLLLEKYPTSRQASILSTGVDPVAVTPTREVTKVYEGIYDMFLEGRFNEAKRAKQQADSLYKTNYWNPQLLYIESVYHIQQREDSTATNILNTLIQQNPEAPIAEKASNLLNVLSRRAEIEEELRNLEIERPTDEQKPREPLVALQQPAKQEEVKQPEEEEKPQAPEETKPAEEEKQPEEEKAPEETKPVEEEKQPEEVKEEPEATQPQPEETKPEETKPEQKEEQPKPEDVSPAPEEKKEEEEPVVQAPAIKRPSTPVTRDTTAQAKPKEVTISNNAPKVVVKDTVAKAKTPVITKSASGYTFDVSAPHYAVVILNKVDNIFGNEARNAFARYNREKYYNAPPAAQVMPLDGENRLLLIGVFPDAATATEYVQKAKPIAGAQIVPWLKAEKYSFTIISEQNLEVLKAKPDLNTYRKFLEQYGQLTF